MMVLEISYILTACRVFYHTGSTSGEEGKVTFDTGYGNKKQVVLGCGCKRNIPFRSTLEDSSA